MPNACYHLIIDRDTPYEQHLYYNLKGNRIVRNEQGKWVEVPSRPLRNPKDMIAHNRPFPLPQIKELFEKHNIPIPPPPFPVKEEDK